MVFSSFGVIIRSINLKWYNTLNNRTIIVLFYEVETSRMLANIDRNYRIAFYLSLITIIANLVEGVFSTILGQKDGTLALFGFGLGQLH